MIPAPRGPALVTGATGFIGSRLVQVLREAGVITFGWGSADVELTSPASVREAVAQIRPATIFHLAASRLPPGEQSEDNVARELAICDNIIEAAAPGTVIVQAGSMAEYGRSGRLSESDRCAPETIYGRAKLGASLHALERAPARDLRVRVARIFGAYGPGERPGRLIPSLLTRLAAGESVPLSDGTQRRDFIHVDDVCRALILLATRPIVEPAILVNVGTGSAPLLRETCERIADMLGADRGLLEFGAIPRRVTDENVLEADTTQLEAAIGEVPPQRFTQSDDAELAAMLGVTR